MYRRGTTHEGRVLTGSSELDRPTYLQAAALAAALPSLAPPATSLRRSRCSHSRCSNRACRADAADAHPSKVGCMARVIGWFGGGGGWESVLQTARVVPIAILIILYQFCTSSPRGEDHLSPAKGSPCGPTLSNASVGSAPWRTKFEFQQGNQK